MPEFSTAAIVVVIAIVVVLGFLLVKVLNKPEPVDESWEVGPTCKPPVVPETDPVSGQKLDPVEVREIMEIIKNQPEELVPPPVLTPEFNPIIQPPPVKKAAAKAPVAKKTPAKKPRQPSKRKTNKK